MPALAHNLAGPQASDRGAGHSGSLASDRRRWTTVATAVLLGLLAVAGAWVSYHFSRWQWHLEGDIAAPYYFWQDFLHRGLNTLKDWRYAQDNWLFSILLPDIGLFSLLGPSPWIVLLQGWAIFLVTCAVFAWLAAPVAGWRTASGVAATMLFASPAIIGGGGCLTYPVTHNVSLLGGLLALACFVAWLRDAGVVWLVIGGGCLFATDMSDPWLSAALSLPLGLASAATAVLRRERRPAMLGVCLTAVLVLLAVRTRFHGALWFLPGSHFQLGSWSDVREHLHWVPIYVSLLLNVVPTSQPDIDWIPSVAIRIVDCSLIGLAMAWAIGRVWQARLRMPPETLFLAASALLGCAGMTAAALLSDVHLMLGTTRYLSNWFYLLPLLVLCAAFGGQAPAPRWATAAGLAWCALFIASGLVALPRQLTSLPPDFAAPAARALVRFLEDHGLTYGYAPYWSTDAAVAQWLSGGRVVVRPVMRSAAGRIVPRIAQTFPSWFEPSDVPAGQRRFFLVAAPDQELCPDVPACVALARANFGPPDEMLHFGNIPVMVWHYPVLTGLPPRQLVTAVPALVPGVPVSFARNGTGLPMLWRGWGDPEANGSWTGTRQAVLLVHLPDGWTGDAVLQLRGFGFPARGIGKQDVTFSVDGRRLAEPTFTWIVTTPEIRVPADVAAQGSFPILLDIPDAGRTSDLRYVYDVRLVGVYAISLVLRHG